jgi:hypothetical protein
MWRLILSDRIRLGSLLAARAVAKNRDAHAAEDKGRAEELIDSLYNDAEWSRELSAKLLGDEPFEG